MVLRESDIEKSVNSCKCPGPFFCTVATTCYEPPIREHHCRECWVTYCKENNIKIEYGA